MPTPSWESSTVRFGDLLRRNRIARGLTQELLAERTGLSVRGISDLERGARSWPQRETLALLLGVLELDDAERVGFLAAARRLSRPRIAPERGPWVADEDEYSLGGRLHRPADAIIGRDQEINRLLSLLNDRFTRLVTITGPGGVGKTRLAIEIAATPRADLAHEVAFVPLAATRDPDLVVGAIAQVLGVRDASQAPVLSHLVTALDARPHLLILDNFEHLLPASSLVAELLAACDGLRILVTSRAALQLSVEHCFPVPPLSVPENLVDLGSAVEIPAIVLDELASCPSIALFAQHAGRANLKFALTIENAGVVAAICRRLEGLPLAIELAAARLSILTPQGLLARLEPRLPLLSDGPRDWPDRLRTMHNAIAWSYELLAPDEQQVFRQLSIFVGGFTLAAATAVAAGGRKQGEHDAQKESGTPPVELLDSMAALFRSNLLIRCDENRYEPRFGMLETIREFGLEQLQASGESVATARRHALYFQELGDQLGPKLTGIDSLDAFDRLTVELPNLRMALTWAVEHGAFEPLLRILAATFPFWWVRANPGEGRHWLELGLAHSQDAAPRTRADALQLASCLASLQADHEPAMRLAEESLELARAERYPLGVATALLRVGQSAEWQGDFALATRCYEEALPIARGLDDPYWAALFLSNLGDAFLWQGDPITALPLAEDGLDQWRQIGNEWGIALALGTVAAVALALGDQAHAGRLCAESLDLWLALGDRRGIAGALAGIAAMAVAQNQAVSAARMLGAARALGDAAGVVYLAHHVGYERALAAVRNDLGEAAFRQAWDAGQLLPFDEAVTEAFACVRT